MANPLRSFGWPAVCLAAVLFASAATPAAASSGGTSAPGADVLAPPAPAALVPAGGALAAMPLKPDTLQSPAGGALVGQVTAIHGQLTVRDASRPVLLEYFDPTHGWTVVGGGRTNAVGIFSIPLRPKHIGRYMFRATTAKEATAPTTTATPTAPIEIYRPVVASVFGAGDYGSKTACGQTLTPELLGVAHLTLPCGTPVDITYANQTITVPVVDRGPYVAGVSYDMTTATAAALGVDETVHVGAVAGHAPAPAGS
jgi:rare lipoprotein A